MAKAGKKGGAGGQTGSRTGANRGAAARKTAPKRGARAAAPAVEAVVVGADEAMPVVVRAEADELAGALREALAEVRALREEVRAARAEAGEARSACREARDTARGLKAEFDTLRTAPLSARDSSGAEAQPEGPAQVRKNRLGVTVAPGVVVAEVVADSPAAAAALIRGDVIEEANGRPVHSGSDLRDAVEAAPAGAEVTLQLRRAGEPVIRTVLIPATTAEGADASKSRFGVTVAPGVVAAEVLPGGPAAAAGLERGDVIEEAHRQEIHSAEQLLTVVHSLPEGSEVPLAVTRAGVRREVVARLDGA